MALPAVVWPNKSAHVYGTGLSWEPGTKAGRAEVGRLLEALAAEAGGVAWDTRGQLCIVVPSYIAGDIAAAVDSVCKIGVASTPEQRAYEIEGPEYWAERIRARRATTMAPWHCAIEINDRAGDVDGDGNEGPTIRYTRLWWWQGERPTAAPAPAGSVEVGAPWEPDELYPEPIGAPPAELSPDASPGLPEHVLESGRYVGTRDRIREDRS
jgi:hypothetical protein